MFERIRKYRPSYAVVVSTLAIVLAGGGTAWAAMYTGKNIKNESLTGNDVKTSALAKGDFSSAAQTYLRTSSAQRGKRGKTGAQGFDGDQIRIFTFHNREVGHPLSLSSANSTDLSWFHRIGAFSGSTQAETLNGSYNLVTDIAQSTGTGGVLIVNQTSDVVVTTSVSLMHRGDPKCLDNADNPVPYLTGNQPNNKTVSCGSDDLSTDPSDDTQVHTRAECWIEKADANGETPEPIGKRMMVSSDRTNEVSNIMVTAGSVLPPGFYTFRTKCRSMDRTGDSAHDEWEFIKGNMTVLSAKQ